MSNLASTDRPPRVLIFSPYGQWYVHSQLEVFLAMSLLVRGAEIRFLGCQGICETCNQNLYQDPQIACPNCWNAGVQFCSQFGLHVQPIDQHIEQQEVLACAQWAADVSGRAFEKESYLGIPIGNSVHAHLFCINRTGSPDFSSPMIREQAKRLLFGGAKLSQALQNLCSTWRPDHAIVLQAATLPPQRVFFDTMRALGIPTLIHERGPVDSSFTFRANEHFCEHQQFYAETKQWFETPLLKEELEATKLSIEQRQKGVNTNFYQMYRQQSDLEQFLSCMQFEPQLPLASILVSSGWEYRIDENRKIFKDQFDGIAKLSELLVKNGYQVAIRYHPNIILKEHQDFRFLSLASDLSLRLPDRTRVILPTEPASSYSLMWLSDAVFTFGSSSGLEACLRGCGTYSTVENYLALTSSMPFPKTDEEADAFTTQFPLILQSLAEQSRAPRLAALQAAYRSYHFNFQRFFFRFKGIAIKDVYKPNITATCIEELQEGFDPTLDLVCQHILTGSSLVPGVPAERIENPHLVQAESDWLKEEIEQITNKRAAYKNTFQTHRSPQPTFSLVRIRLEDVDDCLQTRDIVYRENIARLRHKNVAHGEFSLPALSSVGNFSERFKRYVNEHMQGDWLGFFHAGTRSLEGRLNYALHFLSQDHKPKAFLHGCWIRGASQFIEDEWATFRKPERSHQSLVQKLGKEHSLAHLLACSIWEPQFLLHVLSGVESSVSSEDSLDSLTEKILAFLETSEDVIWYNEDPLCEIRQLTPHQRNSSLKIL
jgi:hypothetical protein